MNACIYTRAVVLCFRSNICVTGCKRSAGADGRGTTAISVRGVGSGVYTGSCAYLSRAYCLRLCESGTYTYVAIDCCVQRRMRVGAGLTAYGCVYPGGGPVVMYA